MLYRPDYLLTEAKRQSSQAWDHYTVLLETATSDRKLLEARDVYIRCHNDVTTISREIQKRDRTNQKTIPA